MRNNNHWRLTKERIIYVMGGKCYICGYEKCIQALEIHHINSEEKEFSLSNSNIYRKWDIISKELQKCILLCANCHREVHYNLIDKNLETSFDSDKSDKVNKAIEDSKTRIRTYCKDCGIEVAANVGRCIACAAMHRRTIERPNREELKNLIRTTAFTTIGKQFNVSDAAIRKWCIKENLPSRVMDIKHMSDDDWSLI